VFGKRVRSSRRLIRHSLPEQAEIANEAAPNRHLGLGPDESRYRTFEVKLHFSGNGVNQALVTGDGDFDGIQIVWNS
jgi:hypothetical protein